MKKLRVILPEASYTWVEFIQEEFRGIALINKGLVDFNPKEVFRWHLSVMFELQEVDEKNLPTGKEIKVIDNVKDEYNDLVIGANKKKPNGLFLARISWNRTVELIWRVYKPEEIHVKLTNILKSEHYIRPFDYRMDDDIDWELAEWHLEVVL